jgi:collagenase-like PrtC family protease
MSVRWNCGRGAPAFAPWFTTTLEQYKKLGLNVFYTFSNPLLTASDLDDPLCNYMLDSLSRINGEGSGVIVASDLLSDYIRERYPHLQQKASIVKSSCENKAGDLSWYEEMAGKFDRVMVHPDDLFDRQLLQKLAANADKYEVLVNENCVVNCPQRHVHYDVLARLQLNPLPPGEAPYQDRLPGNCGRNELLAGIRKSRNLNLTRSELKDIYAMGFRHFKIQGRGEFVMGGKARNNFAYDCIRYIFEPDIAAPFMQKWLNEDPRKGLS